MSPRLAAAVLLAVAAGASAAQPVRRAAPASQCHAGEAVVYSCRFGAALGSVCGAPGRVAYRFGPPGKPAIEIASAADWGNVRLGQVTGGGGGYQDHLRFTAAGHDYVVYESAAGNLTEVPGRHWSGIVVKQDEAEVANLECRGRSALAPGGLDQVSLLAPEKLRGTLADEDPRFDMWF